VTPFEIMAQDCDEVIMLINHFMEKAEHGDKPVNAHDATPSGKQLVKVNDKTATGGWW
jgi:hypothetical protein